MGKDNKFKQNFRPKQEEPTKVHEEAEVQEMATPTEEPAKVEKDKTVKAPVLKKATVVGCDMLRVRTRPTTDADVVRTIKRGSEIEIELVKEGWATLSNGKGFVMEKFIKMNA